MFERFACFALLGLLATACDRSASSSERPVRSPAAAPAAKAREASSTLLTRPRTSAELPTTDAQLFLGNLEGRVNAASKAWKRSGSPLDALMLVAPLASSGKLHADLDRIDRASRIASLALEKRPNDAQLLLARADAHASLHRFDSALADAKRAHALAPSRDSEAMLADLAWNLGDYETAIRGIRKAAQTPSFSSLVRLAQLELDLGNVAAAEDAFARAEASYSDVSPLPIAWLNVQRGLLHLHTGRFEQAEVFYREAVVRMPTYPLAVEHLAEIEALLGKPDKAIERYRAVIAATREPEFMGALAGVLEERGDDQGAAALRRQARGRYATLLEAHPEAMYWHAADFFLEAGDAAKALTLLEKNIRIRPGAGSWAALASAQLAVGKIDAAAVSIERALKSPVRRAELYWTAARVRLAQGQRDQARELEARATRLNPQIARLEGALEESR